MPEYLFLPEMFLNLNRVRFGTTQQGELVDNVKLPKWCDNDPFKYVSALRELMESDYVSANIHLWIDYIFGYKQTGEKAVEALNVYPRITYEGKVNFESREATDAILRSMIVQAYNYGQTPSQLFKDPH